MICVGWYGMLSAPRMIMITTTKRSNGTKQTAGRLKAVVTISSTEILMLIVRVEFRQLLSYSTGGTSVSTTTQRVDQCVRPSI